MRTLLIFIAMVGLLLTVDVSAAPASVNHPIVKEIVNHLVNEPRDMEKKITDAVERYLIENHKPAAASKGLTRLIIDGTRGNPPAYMTKREFCTHSVVLTLRCY